MRRPVLIGGIVTVAMSLAALQLWLIQASWADVAANDWYWRPFALSTVVVGLVYGAAGVMVLGKRPDNRIGLVLSAIGVTVLLYSAASEYALRGLVLMPGSLPSAGVVGVLSQTLWILPFSLVPLLMLLYPTGQFLTAHWRWTAALPAAAVFLIVGVGSVLLWPLRSTGAALLLADPTELGLPGWFIELVVPLVGVALLMGVVSVAVRWRRSVGFERLQIKWLFPAGIILLAHAVVVMVIPDGGMVIGELLLLAGLVAVPIVIVLAVLRYRLYDIDRIVSRSVAYGVITGVLITVYSGLVFVLGSVLPFEGDLAVAVSTLAAAALFNPLRRRVQMVVDRRFNRAHYDAAIILETFRDAIRHTTDLADLGSDLMATTVKLMEPVQVSMWLREDER